MTRDDSQDRDRTAADPAAPSLPGGSLGGWLRAQREARGVSLRDIADASKISLRYLEALEQDRLEVLPAPIFTRGFLREYARVVGLDPDEVVNLYLLAAGEAVREPAGALPDVSPAVASRAGRSTGPSPLGYGLLLVLAVVVFLAVAALLSIWASRRDRREAPPESPRPAAAVRAEPPASVPEPPAAAAVPSAPAASEPARESPPPSAPAAVPPPAAPPAAAPAAVASPLRLVLEFTQDCWVELVVDGQRRTSELRTAGEVVALEAREFVLLTLGNTPGVRVEVDGRPYPLPGGPSRVVRDLRIDRSAVAGASGGASTVP